MDKTKEFIGYLLNKSQIGHSPFLLKWFVGNYFEFMKVPIKPDRHGIPKGDPMPVPRNKLLLALFQVIYPRVSLKKFSEAYDAKYGTVKVWKSVGSDLPKINHELTNEFANLYSEEFQRLVETPTDASVDDYGLMDSYGVKVKWNKKLRELEPLHRLLFELGYYLNPALIGIISISIRSIIEKNIGSYKYREAYMFFREFVGRNPKVGLRLKDHEQIIKDFYEGELIINEHLFESLINFIKKKQTKKAIMIAEHLKFFITKDLMPYYNEIVVADTVDNFRKAGKKGK